MQQKRIGGEKKAKALQAECEFTLIQIARPGAPGVDDVGADIIFELILNQSAPLLEQTEYRPATDKTNH